jgi:hypothetical protein
MGGEGLVRYWSITTRGIPNAILSLWEWTDEAFKFNGNARRDVMTYICSVEIHYPKSRASHPRLKLESVVTFSASPKNLCIGRPTVCIYNLLLTSVSICI